MKIDKNKYGYVTGALLILSIIALFIASFLFSHMLYVTLYTATLQNGQIFPQTLKMMMTRFYMLCVLQAATFLLLGVHTYRISISNRQKLEQMAFVDEITGGISYNKFLMDSADILKRGSREEYAVISMNVDKFKYINDVFGYQEGNNVIRFIAQILEEELHPGEIFAHQSADSFVILMKYTSKDVLRARLDQICSNMKAYRVRNAGQYELILSVGVYQIEDMSLDINKIVDRAELPRKMIKRQHVSTYAFYDDKLRSKQLHDSELENNMEQAMLNHEFQVYYQPKYSTSEQILTGAEALVRWVLPNGTIIPPGDFISVFENNGSVIELDQYVFIEVCRQIREWLDAGMEVVPVSVNLSRLHLYNTRFIDEYEQIVKHYQIPHSLVQLEITERTLMGNQNHLRKVMDQLHMLGFFILMDDFGTGYSSLHMLKDVPVDVLKLDKSFIDDISTNSKGKRIIESIIGLAQSLGMTVTAEGVETKEQYSFLKNVNCDDIQGYYFAKPLKSEDYKKRLDEYKKSKAKEETVGKSVPYKKQMSY